MAAYDASSTNKSKKSVRSFFKDLDLDFTRNVVTNDVVKIEDVNAVKRSVKNLIQTNHYERPFHPELGCGIRELLFENFTPLTGIFIRRKVEEVITNYEPRARLSQVTVNEQPDRNGIEVTVYFYVMNIPEPVSVSTLLQRIR
jgi:phage baseplate assembly protein W